jgi:hypothetical protein
MDFLLVPIPALSMAVILSADLAYNSFLDPFYLSSTLLGSTTIRGQCDVVTGLIVYCGRCPLRGGLFAPKVR